MTDRLTAFITTFAALAVVWLIGYAAIQFTRAVTGRRTKCPEFTIATPWRAFTSTKEKAKAMNHEHQHLIGAKARDLVTGIEGIITAVSYYLNGCVRVCIQPLAKDHKPADEVEWCDVQQVRRIGVGVRQQMGLAGTEAEPPVDHPRTAAVGGPQKDAPKA